MMTHIRAHDEFQKFVSRDTRLLMDQPSNHSGSLGRPIWLSFKLLNLDVKKISGVGEMHHAAIRKWVRAALKAIEMPC
jgi:hypothetical protein